MNSERKRNLLEIKQSIRAGLDLNSDQQSPKFLPILPEKPALMTFAFVRVFNENSVKFA